MRRRREVRIAQTLAGKPVARAHQPADIGEMIADIDERRTDRARIRRAAAVSLADIALERALHDQGAAHLAEEFVVEPAQQAADLDPAANVGRQQAMTAERIAAG